MEPLFFVFLILKKSRYNSNYRCAWHKGVKTLAYLMLLEMSRYHWIYTLSIKTMKEKAKGGRYKENRKSFICVTENESKGLTVSAIKREETRF